MSKQDLTPRNLHRQLFQVLSALLMCGCFGGGGRPRVFSFLWFLNARPLGAAAGWLRPNPWGRRAAALLGTLFAAPKLSAVVLVVCFLPAVAAAQSVNQYSFKRDTVLRLLSPDGKVIAEHRRRSEFVYDDRGRLVERVLFKSPQSIGVPESVIKQFAAGKETLPVPGVEMVSRDYAFRRFGSEVEIKDAGFAHWPAGSQINVYISPTFNRDERAVLLRVLDAWNALIPEIRFQHAGAAEQTQLCNSCLTVRQNVSLGHRGRFRAVENEQGFNAFGEIELGKSDHETLFTMFAHEIGHSLGLDHCGCDSLMRPVTRIGKLIRPTQVEARIVRSLMEAKMVRESLK